MSPQETITKAVADAREWQLAQNLEKSNREKYPATISNQNVSDVSYLAFTDGAWREDELLAGLSWCFKRATRTESTSTQTFQGAKVEEFVTSPVMVEALSMRMALFIAGEKRITKLCIKSDSQVLIRAIKSCTPSKVIFGIQNIKTLIPLFSVIDFHFVPRENNMIADSIAKNALRNRALVIS